MAVRVKVEGLRDLDEALGELPKSTAKAVLRRILKKAGQPIANDAQIKAPVLSGALKMSIGVGTKLTRRQASQHRKLFKNDKASAEMFVGPGGLTQAITQEFGTFKEPPQPFMRPAWDGNKNTALDIIKSELGTEIEAAAKRVARKAARLAAKG